MKTYRKLKNYFLAPWKFGLYSFYSWMLFLIYPPGAVPARKSGYCSDERASEPPPPDFRAFRLMQTGTEKSDILAPED